MITTSGGNASDHVLRCGVVLHVDEHTCFIAGHSAGIRYATGFPAPRVERVYPGNLVAIADLPGGTPAVVWRWYDAVVLGDEGERVRLWEPAHGEVVATARPTYVSAVPGTRAYLSAGLPGAEWWVAGPVAANAADAAVELDEVHRLYTDHDLWNTV